MRQEYFSCAERLLQKNRPALHHSGAGLQVLSMVVCATYFVLLEVRELHINLRLRIASLIRLDVLPNADSKPQPQCYIRERENSTMSIANLIFEIDAEITKLQQVRTLLAGTASLAPKKRGRPAGTVKVVKTVAKPAKVAKKTKRNLSPEGRARIAAAAKARWAAKKQAAKK
jgi:hypothetical protein